MGCCFLWVRVVMFGGVFVWGVCFCGGCLVFFCLCGPGVFVGFGVCLVWCGG